METYPTIGHIPYLTYFHLHRRLLGHCHHHDHSCGRFISSLKFFIFSISSGWPTSLLSKYFWSEGWLFWMNCIITEQSSSPKLTVWMKPIYSLWTMMIKYLQTPQPNQIKMSANNSDPRHLDLGMIMIKYLQKLFWNAHNPRLLKKAIGG